MSVLFLGLRSIASSFVVIVVVVFVRGRAPELRLRLSLNSAQCRLQFYNYFRVRVRQQGVSHCAIYMDPGGQEDGHADQKLHPEADERVTVTARLIRSFAHRNLRPLVLRGVDLGLTGAEFLRLCRDEAARPQSGLPPPFRSFEYDCCKVSFKFWNLKYWNHQHIVA